MNRIPKRLLVYFDEQCPLCLRVAERLSKEACYFPLELYPMRASAKLPEHSHISCHIDAGRFVAEDDAGNLYLDTNARLMALYATRKYRSLSFSLNAPGLRGLVDIFFELLSSNRDALSAFFSVSGTQKLRKKHCQSGVCNT